MRPNFWKNKRVLITGHTGFKGSWLTLWLKSLGAEILGYALKPEGKQNLYLSAKVQKGIKSVFSDIQNFKKLKKTIDTFSPEIVFHLAAQALVKVSYSNPNETLSTNINGTINLLESLKNGKSRFVDELCHDIYKIQFSVQNEYQRFRFQVVSSNPVDY